MRTAIPSAIAIVVIGCLSSGCYNTPTAIGAAMTSPSGFSNELNFVGIGSSVLTRQNVTGSVCPTVQPFSVPFTLHVTAGAVPLTLTQVQFHVTDPFSVQSPPTIFDESGLTRRFGSVTVGSFAVGTFPFVHSFGCGMGGNIILHVSATATDNTGAPHVSTMDVPVR
jgi:hypothetical protein